MRVLFLTHRVPYPPDRGDRIRSFHLLKFLAARCEVHLTCLADEPVPSLTLQALTSLCKRIEVASVDNQSRWFRAASSVAHGRSASEGLFASPQLRRIVTAWSNEIQYDAVLVFCSSMFPYVVTPGLKGVPLIVDLIDVDSQKWFDYASNTRGLKRWLFKLEGRRVRRLEQTIAARAEAVTLVSQPEVDLLYRHAPRAKAHPVQNGVDLDYFRPRPDAEDRSAANCVFVGALDYRANVEGICWFCDHVWPEVRRQVPTATLSLVGRNPVPAVTRLGRLPGVEVVGQVADVRPYLWRANLAIAPLQIARGIQNKVLEAAAAGKAVIASSQALEGLSLLPGRHLLVADEPSEWIAAITGLFADSAARTALGSAAREFVAEHHSWSACLRPFENLLNLPASETGYTPVDASRLLAGCQTTTAGCLP